MTVLQSYIFLFFFVFFHVLVTVADGLQQTTTSPFYPTNMLLRGQSPGHGWPDWPD